MSAAGAHPANSADELSGKTVGRYAVKGCIGTGGMGEVYLAEDTVLKRQVALKRVARDRMADPRFGKLLLKEAQRASSLNHPSVASVYDVLEHDGQVILVMEFVEGAALRFRIPPAMPVAAALRLAMQCAEALEAAHAQGFVHADIKPENIVLTATGDAKVLDFGVARPMLHNTGAAQMSTQTVTGSGGTPGYEAPELLGGADADARSDLFSLGVVLYEVLTGKHPFTAKTQALANDRLLHETPPSPRKLNSAVPRRFDAIVMRLLEKKPESRYAKAHDLLADLRAFDRDLHHPQPARTVAARIVMVAAIVLVGGIAVQWWRTPPKPIAPPAATVFEPHIPASYKQNAKAYEAFLRGYQHLRSDDPSQLDAAISAFSEALAADSNHAPAYAGLGETYWKKYVATHQRELIESAQTNCERAVSLDGEVSDAHLCLGMIADGTGKYEQAVQRFSAAVDKDPASDLAYRGLGNAYRLSGKVDAAEQTFKHAIQLRPQYWAGYAWLGGFYMRTGRYNDGLAQYQTAARLAPNNNEPFQGMGGIYLLAGKPEEAVTQLQKAMSLKPTLEAASNLGSAYLALRRFDDAIRSFEEASRLGPANHTVIGNLARAYYWAPGHRQDAPVAFEKAARLAEDALRVNPNSADNHLLLAYDRAMLDQKAIALREIDRALALRSDDNEFEFFAALIHNHFGDHKTALRHLERAAALGYSRDEMKRAPELDDLHDDPRFQALVRPR